LAELETRAAILPNGAVLLGENVCCDAHARRPLRIVTHAHADHYLGLGESLAKCDLVLMTSATRDILSVIWSKTKVASTRIETLEYGKPFVYEGETICLHNAGHILGSAQVVVTDREGVKVGYTGDFKLPEAEVLRVDLLVMEATYGAPGHVRPFKSSIDGVLARGRCISSGITASYRRRPASSIRPAFAFPFFWKPGPSPWPRSAKNTGWKQGSARRWNQSW